MKSFGFGQQMGGIVQMAYVVEDIRAAIDWWSTDGHCGPFFLLDHFLGPGHIYRGTPATADVAIAMSFAGHMNIELIQPLDSNPSVYRELVARRGWGFHHIGIASDDVERDVKAYEARGYTLAYTAPVPTGGSVAYLDGGAALPHFVELIPATPGMDATFTRFFEAARNWDGKDTIRPFA